MAKRDQQHQASDSSLQRLGRSMSEMAISRRSDSQQQQQKQDVMLQRQASVGFSSCSGRRRRGLFSWGSAAATTSCLPLQQSPPRESITSLLGNESHPPQPSQEDQEDAASAPAAVTSCVPLRTLSRAQSSSSWVVSLVLGSSSSSRSRRAWQEIGSRESQGNPQAANRDLATNSSPNNPLWRTLVRRLVKQRRQMLNGLLGRHRQSSKMVDFSYDESSYAKNFDMGHEAWQREDPSFIMAAAIKQAQCTTIGRSHSVHCLCTGPESIPGGCRNTKIWPQMSAPPLWQRRSIAQPVALSELPLNRSNSKAMS